jgi:5-formyltetrahydrofolate cyclo-ligase
VIPSLAEAKRAARDAARRRRKVAASGRGASEAAGAAAGHLLDHLARSPDGRWGAVAGYLPIGDEIDPMPAIRALHAEGRAIGMPVILAPSAPLGFRAWTPGAPLVVGPSGIAEPEAGPLLRPVVVVVPLLAFDRAGHRLGYGGGYYDRTLAALRREGRVLAIGLAFAAQEAEGLPVTDHDEPLDAIVTEAGIILPAGRRA